MNSVFSINQEALKRPIVIYGAGALGLDCLVELLNQDVYVTCFCDASKEKQKIKLLNKCVISPEELQSMKDTHNIIIAAAAFREIGKSLEQQGIKHLFYYKNIS